LRGKRVFEGIATKNTPTGGKRLAWKKGDVGRNCGGGIHVRSTKEVGGTNGEKRGGGKVKKKSNATWDMVGKKKRRPVVRDE